MPRNGSGVYSTPPGTAAISGELISSAKFNELVADIASDLNLPRPIVAGGIGASNAGAARTNLGVDRAMIYAAKSADYLAVEADDNAVIRFTAAATLSLTAAATLGANWHVTVTAAGGDVVIDPNGSEQINGAETLIVPQNHSATIICDGNQFRSIFLAPFIETAAAGGRNSLSGLTISNNATDAVNDIDIAPGTCVDSTNTVSITLTASLTKRLDALWAAGNNQGGLDTGTFPTGTYHVFAIKNPTTGAVDALFSLSPTAPTLPTGYTAFRRIGSFMRAGSNRAFQQFGDEFYLAAPNLDVAGLNSEGTNAILRTLTVPTGINVKAMLRVRGTSPNAWGVLFTPPDVPDVVPELADAPLVDIGNSPGSPDRSTLAIRTNTSAQIRTRATTANVTLHVVTYGWIDARGK